MTVPDYENTSEKFIIINAGAGFDLVHAPTHTDEKPRGATIGLAESNGVSESPVPDSGFSSVVTLASEKKQDGASAVSKDVQNQNLENSPDKRSGKGSCDVTMATVCRGLLKGLGIITLLYLFICSLDFLSKGFKLLGGKAAGNVFSQSELLQNPITGLMMGVLATVLLQSSSTSTSIVITMVSSGIIDVKPAIPIIMGANIGTTVTNTMVSMAHAQKGREFKRAFAGATVHDVFNWLTVLVLLPLEVATGVLFEVTSIIVASCDFSSLKGKKQDLLKTLTKPLTNLIIQIDEKVITKIAEGHQEYKNKSLIKVICKYDKNVTLVDQVMEVNTTQIPPVRSDNMTESTVYKVQNVSVVVTVSERVNEQMCPSLFSHVDLNDTTVGIIILIFSIILLSVCLIFMVRLLHSMLKDKIAQTLKQTINSRLPSPFGCLTGYLAILIGAGLTMLVQSSSVFTSALTPLVGIGCLKLRRMYPLTLGSNIGTTATGILASLAAPANKIDVALQIALCHLCFNIFGILLYYPLPCMRKIPLKAAVHLGKTTAKYRWFSVFYLILMFFILPGTCFAVSLAGKIPFLCTMGTVGLVGVIIVGINILQAKCKNKLPKVFQNWKWLPKWMRSLEPMDKIIQKLLELFRACCCCCKKGTEPETQIPQSGDDLDEFDEDDFDDDIEEETPECEGISRIVVCCCNNTNKDEEVQKNVDDEGFVDEDETLLGMKQTKSIATQPRSYDLGGASPIFKPKNKKNMKMSNISTLVQDRDVRIRESGSQTPLLQIVTQV